MDNKEAIRKELSELSSGLEKIEKKNPFKVPDFYFQAFPDTVIDRIRRETTASWVNQLEGWLNHAFSLIFRPRYAIPVTVFLLSLVVVIKYYNQDDAVGITSPLSEVSSDEIDDYILENFDDDDLIALGGFTGQMNGFIPDEVSDEELESFLEDNTDNQTLEEEIL